MTQPAAETNPAWSYERDDVPALFGPWATEVVHAAGPRPGERVLDVGCGTGVVARRVAPIIGPTARVVGLDRNPNMLEVAAEVAAQEGLAIEWRQGDVQAMPFPDGSFDLVTAQFVLMFLPDRPAGLSEIHRVLKEGGRLVLTVWQSLDLHPFLETLHLVLLRRFGIDALKQPFSLGDEDQLRRLLVDAGFKNVSVHPMSKTHRFPNPEKFLQRTVEAITAAIPAVQHLDEQKRRQITTAVQEEMDTSLRRATQGDHVVQDWHAYIVQAGR